MADQLQYITLATPVRRFQSRRVALMMTAVERRETALLYRRFAQPYAGVRRLVNGLAGLPDVRYPNPAPFEEQVKRLEFIHFARWTLVPRLPGERRLRSRPLNFFVTNFDGGSPDYIGSFVDGFGVYGMSTQWGSTPGWPRRDATVDGLIRFAFSHAIAHQHEFKPYGALTTGDIRHALRLDRELRSFAVETRGATDRAWFDEFHSLLRRLQMTLSRPAGEIAPTNLKGCETGATRGHLWGLMTLSAFPREQLADVKAQISALAGDAAASPFATVPGCHMARLGVFDEHWDERHKRPVKLDAAYVLYAADFQVPQAAARSKGARLGTDFAAAARAHLAAAFDGLSSVDPGLPGRIWGHCDGFPAPVDRASFVRFFALRRRLAPRRSRVYEPNMSFVDYPSATPGDVARAAATQARFMTLLETHGRFDGPNLRARFDELAADLPPVPVS